MNAPIFQQALPPPLVSRSAVRSYPEHWVILAIIVGSYLNAAWQVFG